MDILYAFGQHAADSSTLDFNSGTQHEKLKEHKGAFTTIIVTWGPQGELVMMII